MTVVCVGIFGIMLNACLDGASISSLAVLKCHDVDLSVIFECIFVDLLNLRTF